MKAIIAAPEDDLPRLVVADWLEENNGPTLAKFIRLQVSHPKSMVHMGRDGRVFQSAMPTHWGPWKLGALKTSQFVRYPPWRKRGPGPSSPVDEFVIRRGFVNEVRLPLAAWLEWGPRLVRSHPLESVRLSDRVPLRQGVSYYFYSESQGREQQHTLPDFLMTADGGRIYRSSSAGSRPVLVESISRRLISWAKQVQPELSRD